MQIFDQDLAGEKYGNAKDTMIGKWSIDQMMIELQHGIDPSNRSISCVNPSEI